MKFVDIWLLANQWIACPIKSGWMAPATAKGTSNNIETASSRPCDGHKVLNAGIIASHFAGRRFSTGSNGGELVMLKNLISNFCNSIV